MREREECGIEWDFCDDTAGKHERLLFVNEKKGSKCSERGGGV